MESDVRKFCLQSFLNIQSLSLSSKALPRIGRPFGPGGTFRHGLLAYCTATIRMTTMLKRRPPRRVRCWESAANETQWKDSRVLKMGVVGLTIIVVICVSEFEGDIERNAGPGSLGSRARKCVCARRGEPTLSGTADEGIAHAARHERRTAGTRREIWNEKRGRGARKTSDGERPRFIVRQSGSEGPREEDKWSS